MGAKSLIQNMAGRAGLSIRRQLDAADFMPLFAAMKPVETDLPLIRIGGDGDGGYLVPDDLDGIQACFSPGVDLVADFEREMIARGIPTFQIDASVERSPLEHPMNRFERKFLGIDTRGQFISLDDWVAECAPGDGDLLMQIDIEGAEWPALAAASRATLERFRIIVIEMHHLDYLSDRVGASTIAPVIDRLADIFHFVHLHANNVVMSPLRAGALQVPGLIEATLLRKDRTAARGAVRSLPHPLDRPNVAGRPDLEVPRWMYG